MAESTSLPPINPEMAVEIISKFIEDVMNESKTKELVMGLSGGIDSSTTAYLCAKSVETSKILGLIMPSETTSASDVDDAKSVAEKLGIEYEVIPIDRLIEPFPKMCPHTDGKLAKANLKPRIRMMILYYHSNSMNRLVIGTGNRTELLVGYFTKYGDGGVDILPIGDLYKTHIIQLADYLGVPENIIKKSPTAGLWAGQTDEEELGVSYKLLDQILHLLVDRELTEVEVAEYLEISVVEVLRIKKMIRSSQHKLISPSMVKVR